MEYLLMEEIEESPLIELDTAQLGRIALTWFNTEMFNFKDNTYDHVTYTDDKGIPHAFIPSVYLSDMLHENDYPSRYRPLVDDATERWHERHVAMIFNEIKEVLGEDNV